MEEPLPPGLAVEDTKSFLFSPDGQNGSIVWRKRVASSENNVEAFVDFL